MPRRGIPRVKTHSKSIRSSICERCAEKIESLPSFMRGSYVLYQKGAGKQQMDVVYVGMARGDKAGAKGRLLNHRREKRDLWTHCSVFEVWDNIFPEQVEELEGLFRHLYRFDINANKLNKQKAHAPLTSLTRETSAST